MLQMSANEYKQMIQPKTQPKNAKMSLIGRQNRDNGQLFEELISAGCKWYLDQGMADIEKTPEPMKPIQNYGNGT